MLPSRHHDAGADPRRPDGLEVAHLLARYGDEARRRFVFSPAQERVIGHLLACRTEALGGHLDACDECGFVKPSYNSCRDRHCPKCQATRQAHWVALRLARILPVPHYHVVFTLPGLLRPLVRANRRRLFDLLFRAASETLAAFARDPRWLGAQLGVTTVLHTWTRDLRFHPHLHCVVTAGGLADDGERWVRGRYGDRFLFPVGALGKVFRGKLLDGLRHLRQRGELRLVGPCGHLADGGRFARFLDRLYRMRWLVYAKRPFSGAKHVFSYLGRYTHRVAISNQRLIALDDHAVRFGTKNGRVASLEPAEFIRRFLDHVLPDRFVKIRHYGLYASSHVTGRLERARALLPPERAPTPLAAVSAARSDRGPAGPFDWRALFMVVAPQVLRCPVCKKGTMQLLEGVPCAPHSSPRGPP